MIHTEDAKNFAEYLDIMNEKDMDKKAKRLRESIASKVRKGGEKEIKAVHDMAKMIAKEAMNNCDRTMKEIEEDDHVKSTGVVMSDADGMVIFLCSVSAAIQTYLDVEEIVFEEMTNRAYTRTAHECKCKAKNKQKEGKKKKRQSR